MSLNKVSLIGRLGKAPEIRTTQDGREIANFSVATSEHWKDKTTGEKKEKTEWHKVVVFQPGLVNIVKSYVKQGSKIYLEGSLQTRKWQDKGGQDKYTTEIVLQGFHCTLVLLDSKKEEKEEGYSEEPNTSNMSYMPSDTGTLLDDEIPF